MANVYFQLVSLYLLCLLLLDLKCVIFKTKLTPQYAPPEFSISGNGNFILPVTQSKGCGVIIDSFSSHSTFNYQQILLPLPKRHGLLQSHSEWNPKFILSPKRPSWTGPLTSLALFPTSLPIPFFLWATGCSTNMPCSHLRASRIILPPTWRLSHHGIHITSSSLLSGLLRKDLTL